MLAPTPSTRFCSSSCRSTEPQSRRPRAVQALAAPRCWTESSAWTPPPVFVAHDAAEATRLLELYFPPGTACGYDVACKPRGWPPGAAPEPLDGLPALIQLASPEAVVILQLQHMTPRWPDLLSAYERLVGDPATVLLGCSIAPDVKLVHGCLTRATLVDLGKVSERLGAPALPDGTRPRGLSALLQAHGGPALTKTKKVQLANWAKKNLSPAEIEYAALDAFAGGWIAGRMYERAGATLGFRDWLLSIGGGKARPESPQLAASRRSLLALSLVACMPLPASRASAKRTGLSDAEVRDELADGLRAGYFVRSSAMPVAVFADNCRFKDPTTDVIGLSRYLAALDVLFDPETSAVTLLSAEVVAPRRILARWTLGGRLKLPWRPRVPPFEGTATYTLNEEGLVIEQRETWDISAAEALRETFTPGG